MLRPNCLRTSTPMRNGTSIGTTYVLKRTNEFRGIGSRLIKLLELIYMKLQKGKEWEHIMVFMSLVCFKLRFAN